MYITWLICYFQLQNWAMLVSQRVKYNEEYKISYTLPLFFQVLSNWWNLASLCLRFWISACLSNTNTQSGTRIDWALAFKVSSDSNFENATRAPFSVTITLKAERTASHALTLSFPPLMQHSPWTDPRDSPLAWHTLINFLTTGPTLSRIFLRLVSGERFSSTLSSNILLFLARFNHLDLFWLASIDLEYSSLCWILARECEVLAGSVLLAEWGDLQHLCLLKSLVARANLKSPGNLQMTGFR